MRSRSRRVNTLCFGLLVWLAAMSAPTSAHHSMAMYDHAEEHHDNRYR